MWVNKKGLDDKGSTYYTKCNIHTDLTKTEFSFSIQQKKRKCNISNIHYFHFQFVFQSIVSAHNLIVISMETVTITPVVTVGTSLPVLKVLSTYARVPPISYLMQLREHASLSHSHVGPLLQYRLGNSFTIVSMLSIQ